MEWIALALICPLTMGLMMLFMMRGMRNGHDRDPKASGEHGSPTLAAGRGAEANAPLRPESAARRDHRLGWGWKIKLGARGAPGSGPR
jgi:hypothetical protein